MKTLRPAWTVCLFLAAGSLRGAEELGPEFVARTPPLSPADERAKFHLPPGFEAELVAAEPQIRKPMNLAFDDRGRLWATESVEYPFPAKEGAGRDSLKIFEDTDGDGRADKVTVFATGLNIPIGLIPLPDGALVYSIVSGETRTGKIYRLFDRDGDDREDERRELYGTFQCVDTHGMVNGFRLGLDGWLYSCHGYSNTSEVKGTDGKVLRMNSGNTFRMRLDGSHAEQFSHGQVNPFGIAFDPLMNLFSADCHSQPAYQVLRGAFYPSFGKPHDGLGFGPEIMRHDHGSTAICGIVYYAADDFPPEYRDTIFIGNVVTNRINHDRLERHGSSVKALLQPDFLSSDDPWFRPVDLQLGPDGALYVADFYNRIIGHYEVPLTHPGRDHEHGRIWRIVHRGKDATGRKKSPDLARARLPELIEALGHPNLTVRTKATHQLVDRGGMPVIEAVRAALRAPPGVWVKVHGLWVLERLGGLDGAALAAAAADPDAAVRVHAQHVLAERGMLADGERKLVFAALADPDPLVQRAAADALGTHPDPANLAALFDLRKKIPPDDVQLLHVARMALRNQLRLPESWKALAALGGADDALVADVAPGVHSEASASFLLAHLKKGSPPGDPSPEAVQYLARYLPQGERPELHNLVRSISPADLSRRAAMLSAVQRGTEERGGELGEEMKSLAREISGELLASADAGHVKTGIELARGLKLGTLEDRLTEIASSRARPDDLRKLSLEALTAMDPARPVPLLSRVLADGAETFALREEAALRLGEIRRPESLEALAVQLRSSPERLASRIAAGLVKSAEGCERLLVEVAQGKASARLLKAREVEGRLSRSGIPALKERLEKLTAGLPEVDERLEKLIEARRKGFPKAKPDLARGALVFEKTCAPCHKLGDKGKKIGPELAGIGNRGLDRLLEDTLDPSRNVDQTFTATVVVEKNGLLHTGLLTADESEVLVLADAEGKEVRIRKSEVKTRERLSLSPMPSNVGETMPEADFYDLLAYLLAQREKPAAAP